MRKSILCLFLFLLCSELRAQGDTVIAIISHKQFSRHFSNGLASLSDFYPVGDTLVWGRKVYLAPRDTALVRKTEAFQRSCFGKYFKFKTHSGVPVAEGRWVVESFVGFYKEYYKNGVLKVEGNYSVDTARKKNGVWHYYSKRGILYKSINYSLVNSMSYKLMERGVNSNFPYIMEGNRNAMPQNQQKSLFCLFFFVNSITTPRFK